MVKIGETSSLPEPGANDVAVGMECEERHEGGNKGEKKAMETMIAEGNRGS
jgi:hypothetical protein